MGWLVFVLILAMPATILAKALGWLSIEYALVIIWAAFFLIAALGLLTMWLTMWRPSYRDL